jgi:RNA polymerase sigma factor (sigma-70 family)
MNQSALFETIYHATFKAISKYVYFNSAQLADAEDIVQNVYAHFYHSVIQKDKTVENPQAYLMTMAKHELALYYKDKASQAVQLDEETTSAFENIPDETDLALETIERFSVDQIYKQIETMDPLDQKILGGRFRYELTFAEIAKAVEISENTIKTRYYRAIQSLKQKLDTVKK